MIHAILYFVQFYDEYDFDILGELLFIPCWYDGGCSKIMGVTIYTMLPIVSSSFFAFLLAH